ELGAASVIRGDGDAAVRELYERTGGQGADYVFETVGGSGATVDLSWRLARRQGTVALVGVFPHKTEVDLLAPLGRELWVTFPLCYGTIDGRHDFDVAIELIAAGRAPV